MQEEPTVMHEIVRSRQWGLATAFQILEGLERVARLRETFLVVCRARADEDAVVHFGWLMRAIAEADAEANPLPDRKADWQAHDRAEREGKIRVAVARADEAMALYEALPTTGQGTAREWLAQDESRLVPINVATLLKTRKAILLEIGKGWRDAATHEEAERYFLKLQEIEQAAKFREYREPVPEVIRETLAGHGFPFERLVWTIRAHPKSPYAEILAHAWVKGLRSGYRERGPGELIAAVAEYAHASEGAVEYLRTVGDRLLAFDRLLHQLKGLPHHMQIEYGDSGTATIVFEVKEDYRTRENDFHRQFERIRNELQTSKLEWTQPHRLRVSVEGRFVREYDKKVLQQRKEQI